MDISVRISLHLMLSAWTQDIKTKNAKRLKRSQRNYFSFDHSFIIIIGQFYSAHLSIIQWKRGISFCSTNESTLFSNVGVAFPAHVGILSLVGSGRRHSRCPWNPQLLTECQGKQTYNYTLNHVRWWQLLCYAAETKNYG